MAKFANTKGLSKQEKFIIQGMLVENNSIEDISKYLERELDQVESYVVTLVPQQDEEDVANDTTSVDNFMITRTQNGNKGVVAMTETASQRAEHNRSKRVSNADRSNYIHVIKPNKK